MKTKEVEVLAKVAETAFVMGGSGEWDEAIHADCEAAGVTRQLLDVARAVARAVRAQDEARGGTLTAEDVEELRGSLGNVLPKVPMLFIHSAAQGRAIAALQRENDEARRLLATRVEASRLEAAESALATLRQAVGRYAGGLITAPNVPSEYTAAIRRDLKAMAGGATPAEHPETATLRAIRERGQDDNRMLEAMDDAPISPDLLRDSDGDEGWAKVRAQARALRDYLLGDSGPSGGGETRCRYGNEGGPCTYPPLADGWCRAHQHIGELWRDAPTAYAKPTTPPSPSGGGETLDDWMQSHLGVSDPMPNPTTPPDVAASDDPHAAYLLREMEAAKRCERGEHRAQGPAAGEGASLCAHCGTGTTAASDGAQRCVGCHRDGVSLCASCEANAKASQDAMASEPRPTPEEDWRTVEAMLDLDPDPMAWSGKERQVVASLARLKAEPRRAAEAMRERCARKMECRPSCYPDDDEVCEHATRAHDIRALPL